MAQPFTYEYPMIYFDLEWIGPDIRREGARHCFIWNIAAVSQSGATFDRYVIPPSLEYETHPGCIEVTETLLNDLGAVTFRQAFKDFAAWVGPRATLISHNCFRADKPVLEAECKRYHIEMPSWRFFDSLLFMRANIKQMSYKLGDLYENFYGEPIENQHYALADAVALKLVMNHVMATFEITKFHFAYPKYLTPLQNIRWLGCACEEKLEESGIYSVEDLLLRYITWVQTTGCVTTLLKQFLGQYDLPLNNMDNIAREMAEQWIPASYGGLSYSSLFTI